MEHRANEIGGDRPLRRARPSPAYTELGGAAHASALRDRRVLLGARTLSGSGARRRVVCIA
ncbi:hypothetical protein ACFPYM_05315, partial [Methylobacterium hispanicum]